MRRLLTIALTAAAALLAVAQPSTNWLERQHDFGVILEENGKVTCQLRVVNSGDAPLLIVKAQASCGCTGVNYPETPIEPGDTATVAITYNPSGRPGQFNKQVILFTNATPKRTILEINGNVIPSESTLNKQYPLQAGSLYISQGNLPFGELVKGQNKSLFLSAYNASTDTLLVSVDGDRPHIRPTVVPDTVPPARVTALTVHYISRHAPQWGLNVDTLTLACEPLRQPSTATTGTATINVMAQVIEDFGLLTDKQRQDAPVVNVDCGESLDFGNVTAGETVTHTFTITNKGKSPLAIRRLWIPENEGITVSADRSEVKRGKSVRVSVTVDTTQLQGELLNVPLTLMTNDPEASRLTIRLVGIINQQ